MVTPAPPKRNQYPLGELIRRRREELELSQTFVAGKVGIDQSTLARWENGERIPTGPLFRRLSQFLRFTEQELAAAQTSTCPACGGPIEPPD